MRLAAFIISLLLLAGSIDPTRGWLIALVVLTAVAALRPRLFFPFMLRPRLDLRVASLVIAVLLLAGAVDPTRGWLIALSVVTGLAAFMPRLFALDGRGGGGNGWGAWCDWSWDGGEGRPWRRERRFGRRARRAGWEEDWS